MRRFCNWEILYRGDFVTGKFCNREILKRGDFVPGRFCIKHIKCEEEINISKIQSYFHVFESLNIL